MPPPSDPKTSGPKGSHIQWILKSTYGEEMGPYATPEVLKLIEKGNLQGDEKIRKFPHGKWIEISKQAEFYDSLLSVLEESVKSDPQAKTRASATRSIPLYEQKDENTLSEIQRQETQIMDPNRALVPAAEKKEVPKPTPQPLPRTPPRSIIDLPKPPPPPMSDERRKRTIIGAAAVIVFAGIVSAVMWFSETTENENKPHLLSPRIQQSDSMNQKEATEMFNKAVANYLEDSYEGYQQSQNLLVSIIEGMPKSLQQNIKARGLLCLVYKELWPYVAQDSQDLETVRLLSKATKQMDPFEVNGTYCEAMLLMVSGKFKDTLGVLNQVLGRTGIGNTSAGPILNTLKAEIYSASYDLQSIDDAISFAKMAAMQFPQWVKPQFALGNYYAKAKKTSEALQAYEETLKRNPKHKGAMVEIGILQYREFHQIDQAFNQLLSAVESSRKIEDINLARAYLALSEIYLDKVEPRKALDYAKLAYDLNPGDGKAKEMIMRLGGKGKLPQNASQTSNVVFQGDSYFRSGDYLTAQGYYKSAFELDPSNGIAAFKAAKCLWQLNQSDEAIHWLSKAIEADKRLVAAYVLQADYYSQRYNFVAASKVLNLAAQTFPNNYEILRGLGLVEYRRNNPKQALAYLQRSIKIYGNDVETLILLASVNSALRIDREALNFAGAAIQSDPTSIEAKIVYVKASAQLSGIDAAIAYLQNQLIAKYSTTIEFRIALAELYKERERYKEAMDIYKQVVEVDPKNKKAFLGLGEAYQMQNMPDMAMKAYLSAAIVDPSDAEGVFRTGILYYEGGKYKEAVLQFARALQVNPFFPKVNYFIGKSYFQNGEFDKALQHAMAERKANPNLADSFILAAEVYTAAKQYAKCADEYQGAIKLRPQGSDLYVKIARCYRQGGSLDIAENMLNLAANQESGNPEIYKEQGAIYQQKGDSISAVKAYNKYLLLSPNAPDRNEIEAQILKLSSGK